MREFVVASESELIKVAECIADLSAKTPIACFEGEMGAGKTTLIKQVCGLLGVKDSMSSPTFSIVNEYRDVNDNPVYHFDFYRIEALSEAVDIGVEEYFYSENRCFIEWPERINELIPEDHLKISIKLQGDNDRKIIIVESNGG